ncbi:MAG: heme o synthase [Thermoguttaceae bacterium]
MLTPPAERQPKLTTTFTFAPPSDYWRLVRPRIIGLVLFTMAVSALVAGREIPAWTVMAHSILGAALVIAGAIALNQRIERRTDALMFRTARRPLPSGRMTTGQATCFGIVASVLGLLYLAIAAQPAVVALTLISWVVYVWIYTPLKIFSAWQTPWGALAGAMPCLMGGAVAGAPWSVMSLTLFGIVYFWQFPHAMAIAWIYRKDFAAANLKVATVTDPSGRTAALLSLTGALLLLPVSLAPCFTGAAGWGYGLAAILPGTAYLARSIVFLRRTDDATARRLLHVSLLYLPLVFLAALAIVLLRS